MIKKIFALVMVISVLGAFMAGCSKPADDTAKPADTATTTGTATATSGTATATAGDTK
jgi:hypothetical protein